MTGWPAGLLQDGCRKLSKWLASRIDAKQKVREMTQKKNGCHDHAPYVETVVIRRLAVPAVTFKNAMSKECQYCKTDLGKADKGCDGCVWRKTE